ncbi:MAG: hypothetical protein IPO86_04540 [Saprospiraceae bacterium]|nr:hypothetical protein [Saprospiraceae bacterium]
MKKIIILIFWIFTILLVGNQNCISQINSLRCKVVNCEDSINLTDSLLISGPSIKIQSLQAPTRFYDFDFNDSTQILKIKYPIPGDSIRICYRVFQLAQKRSYFLFDSSIRQDPARPDYANPGFEIKSNTSWWNSPGINYTGNFTRGISTGNNQSLVLNSNLNLQLSGDLGDGFSLLGAISDNQIPIQPEGNTRQIQEFDRLFIKLSKKNQHLTVGDFEISKPAGYFLNYYKKNKGGLLETKHKINNWNLESKSVFAISKGKSNRLNLKTQNGNQGPYRLSGNNGEQFIILLAGSEKVWIDGDLIQRGEDADYSIDYNLAEIRFTPKRIISDISRVIIEFEYLDQNYTRSLALLQSSIKNNNIESYFNFYNEQDSKTPAVATDLDSLDKATLIGSGDDIKLAVRSGIRKAGSNFNINRIYYRERDTLVIISGMSVNLKYLIFDPNADSTALQVGFSEVVSGKGNYILKQSTANGRVYEWIAPDVISGNPKGNYEPVIPLIAPQQIMMMNAGILWKGNHNNLSGGLELALSSVDKNRLSNIQDNDNQGLAFKFQTSLPTLIFSDSLFKIKTNLYYEYNQKNFSSINPYRNVEFARDWNITSQTGSSDHLPRILLNASIGSKYSLNYEHMQFIRSIGFKGQKNTMDGNWNDSLTNVQISYNILQTQDANERSSFERPGFLISRKLPKNWKLQLQGLQEKNTRYLNSTDSLSANSFYFKVLEARLQKDTKKDVSISFTVKHRLDYLANGSAFTKHSISDEAYLESQIDRKQLGILNIKVSGKRSQYTNSQLNDSLAKIYFLGALDHQINIWKKLISFKNYYELQSGVEPRQEFVFEEKRPGEGNFIFMDFNKDGVRQIYEYVYAPDIDTARFVRFQLLNSEYVQIYQSSWNQFINIDPKNVIQGKSKFSKIVSAFYLETGFRFNSKVNKESEISTRINPLYFIKNKSDLIGYASFIQQNLYYNRAHPIYEIQTGFQQTAQKILLTSGSDEKKLQTTNLKARFTTFKKLDCNLEFFSKKDDKVTQFYLDQNYRIQTIGFHPFLVYRMNPYARMNAGLSIRNATEKNQGKERADFVELELGSALFLFKKLSIRSELKYISIQFQGESGSIIEFNMLDGYKDGNNYNWDLQFDYKINSLIQLQFSYSGRKAASSETLHTGRMQLRANF